MTCATPVTQGQVNSPAQSEGIVTTASPRESRVESWEECERKVLEFENLNADSHTKLLFRGQHNSKWLLETTLERRARKAPSIIDFYRMILRIAPEIQSYYGPLWSLPTWEEVEHWCKDYDAFTLNDLPAYDYLAYLRHHAFPSPLLDWTSSLYVAAYFAFWRAEKDDVAIYIFSERPCNLKGFSSSDAQIHSLGHYVRTHRRHFRQQSRYTFCAKFDSNIDMMTFRSHHDVFKSDRTDQDVLRKIIIPASERCKVLTTLDKYNLNSFLLFDTEESLMETMAFREIDLEKSLNS